MLDRSLSKTLVLFTIFVLTLTSCTGGGPPLGYVTGTVSLDGKPLANARVQFQPEAEGRPSFGISDDVGKYEIGYTMNKKGAQVGNHRVQITTAALLEQPNGSSIAVEEKLPDKYNAKSELHQEVKAGRNTINFELLSK